MSVFSAWRRESPFLTCTTHVLFCGRFGFQRLPTVYSNLFAFWSPFIKPLREPPVANRKTSTHVSRAAKDPDDTRAHRFLMADIVSGKRHVPQNISEVACQRASQDTADLSQLSPDEVKDLFFQLRVHQEELQIINEDLVKAQKQLAHTRDRYADLYEFAPVGYISVDDSHAIRQSNLTACAMLGRSRKRLLGKKLPSLVIDEDREKCFIHLRCSMQSSVPNTTEVRFVRADGSVFVAETQVTQTQALHGKSEWRIVLSDVTERKILENKLSGERKLLQTIIDTIPVMIIIWDPEADIVRVNRAFETITGWANRHIRETNILTLIYPQPQHPKETTQSLESLQPGWRDIRVTTKSGRVIETSWAQVEIPDGRRIGIGIDVHERKEMEQELRRRAASLEVANEELESFSYSVSHDLRAPLHSMQAFTDALMEDYSDKLDSLGKEYVQRIDAASDRMVRLIDEMLKLARITRQEMDYEIVDVSLLAATFSQDLQNSSPDRRVLWVIHEKMFARADRQLLNIALRNLIRNAWKYTGHCDDPRIEIGYSENQDGKVFFVRDNGVGFDPAHSTRLFTPFQRLHSDKEFPGTGIGLPIVQRAIRRHGGEIWAESTPGHGAAFYFTLPE